LIPVVLLLGAVAGRWWVVPLAVVVWSLVVGVSEPSVGLFVAAAGLAALNAAVGVVLHRTLATGARTALGAWRTRAPRF